MLTGNQIKIEILDSKRIIHKPFDEKYINPNSIDVRLADDIKAYSSINTKQILDPRNPYENYELKSVTKTEDGKFILHPNKLYLGSTIEECGSDYFIPMINGKSSLGRLGITIHITAGFGDIGFKRKWTLEMTVVEKTILYPGMRIGQICFFEPVGAITKYDGKYKSQDNTQGSIPYADDSEY